MARLESYKDIAEKLVNKETLKQWRKKKDTSGSQKDQGPTQTIIQNLGEQPEEGELTENGSTENGSAVTKPPQSLPL